MSNDLVSYSRAGDVFHYRWAARRCLQLIRPNTSLQKITIEGSDEKEKAGEYVIDVAEYSLAGDGRNIIDYYQLKHTTVQQDIPFELSNLKGTFVGFAQRFVQHKDNHFSDIAALRFTIITNRKVSQTLKQKLTSIVERQPVDRRFTNTLEDYTKLSLTDLVQFCSLVRFEDSEGDYNIQNDELRRELTQLFAGSVDNAQVNNLVALVQGKVLPDSNRCITREDVLSRFGITSEKQLYPAPAMWEELDKVIERAQYNHLIEYICNVQYPVIVHAGGGVGKSVFTKQLIDSLPESALGIAYDCFGAGSYRNRSAFRHGHRHALVQIANELSSKGLCDPLIVHDTTLDEDIMRKFLVRVKTSVETLRQTNDQARLYIVIDAADNAEMAAHEVNQPCFAHELLREMMPAGCQLIMLCRTERIALLQPQSHVIQLELQPFCEEETTENLKSWFPDATKQDSVEFHRLTSGNPRVQAMALDAGYTCVRDLLSSLGPAGTSIERQIEMQLNAAVTKSRELFPEKYNDVDSICLGLASLPPYIPIVVLSKASDTSVEAVKSFISDIGRSLWLSDDSVQFRDEPTETWFRTQFLASNSDYEAYVKQLEPLAGTITYVAIVLPQLYLQAKQYDKLIDIALSDNYLPENPIDARNVRVQRLQFAFKAALKAEHFDDAIKLAMRAGEEMAGNQRQLELLQSNIDLLPRLQSHEKMQEIAFRRLLSSDWDGSENVYTASLLSGIPAYQGEARGYLRAADNWMHLFFEEKRKKKVHNQENSVTDKDVLEFAYAHLNIFGAEHCFDYLCSWRPKGFIFRIVQDLTHRLIDLGRFAEINDFLVLGNRDPYFIVAITGELSKVGRIPEQEEIETCLELLCSSKCRLKKSESFNNDRVTPAIVSFLEACLYRNLTPSKILRVLRYYVPYKASRSFCSTYQSDERDAFLKSLAIRMVLSGSTEVRVEEILPEGFEDSKKKYPQDRDINEFKEVVLGLSPWYLLRGRILYAQDVKLLEEAQQANESSRRFRGSRYRNYDPLPMEISKICAFILILYDFKSPEEVSEYYHRFLSEKGLFNVQVRLNTLRAVCRLPRLSCIRQELELSISELSNSYQDDGPEEIANRYVALARAVLTISVDDACAYFEDAVTGVSKFGDEITQRWAANVALAKRTGETGTASDELAYRFIRCAELVGENVTREKYWDRGEAMQVCARMSSGIGLSALSRWCDRDIGNFESQLDSVLFELVGSKTITSGTGWALTRLLASHQQNRFLSICLLNEPSQIIKQKILDDAVYLLQIEGTEKECWTELQNIASEYKLRNPELDNIILFYTKQEAQTCTVPDNKVSEPFSANSNSINWDDIFSGISITTPDGFETIVERYRSVIIEENCHWHLRDLLKEIINRIGEESIWPFIDILLMSDEIDKYSAQYVLGLFSEKWKTKASFKKKWPTIIRNFGKRYSHELTNRYSLDYLYQELNLNEELIKGLKTGIFLGLSEKNESVTADSFFGFVEMASSFVLIESPSDLLDYSLSRFELHISDDFGDGPWGDWFRVSTDINKNVAGLIWATLGSPRSAIRWNAAHCVKKLAELNCTNILDALIWWLEHDKVDAFGCNKFPFYNLHARQYLLIALARISLDQPDLLRKHSHVFSKYALTEPHILIQKYASDIALNLETKFPSIYESHTLIAIKGIGKSNLPIQKADYGYVTDSYWHKEGTIDAELDYNFGWDFDRYWYEPLGEVFGIPEKQVEDLAANVIINEWKITEESGYNKDPRVDIWNKSSYGRETYHSHGSYPKTDNLNFYLSYHAMLVVAAKLISKMPVIKQRDWCDDEWIEWLSRHLLTREDGKWLSEARGALPLKRPEWIVLPKDDAWHTNLTEKDFINCLKEVDGDDIWLNIKGGWTEKHIGRKEIYSISSALVSSATSDALLRALSTCTDPYNYKLPDYGEKGMEIHTGDFCLRGWISHNSISIRLDESDPYADNVSYPPYTLDGCIRRHLDLSSTDDGTCWRCNDSEEVSLKCEIWSKSRERTDDDPDQYGMRLKANVSFLKHLCQTFKCHLIIDVGIGREISYRYDRENRKYTRPQHVIFILSEDGKLKNTDTSYNLG